MSTVTKKQSKKQYSIKLRGVLPDGTPAKTQQSDEVVAFHGFGPTGPDHFKISHPDFGLVTMTTPKGEYTEFTTDPYASVHRFEMPVNGGVIKAQVTFKKIVGTLIYWA